MINALLKPSVNFIFILSAALNWFIPAHADEQSKQTMPMHFPSEHETFENEAPPPGLHFRFFAETEKDQFFETLLKDTHTLEKITRLFEENFKVRAPIHFHIQHVKESQLIEAEVQEQSHIISLPYRFMYTLYQGLSSKYNQQTDVINALFAASVEFYIWTEMGRIFLQENELTVSGREFTATDNFTAFMMLNQNSFATDFIVDASEAYLLIHSSDDLTSEQAVEDELASDQKRYKHILCLTIGFDHLTEMEGIDHLQDFSLDSGKIRQCQQYYLNMVSNWHEALGSSLKEDNLLNVWLQKDHQDPE